MLYFCWALRRQASFMQHGRANLFLEVSELSILLRLSIDVKVPALFLSVVGP